MELTWRDIYNQAPLLKPLGQYYQSWRVQHRGLYWPGKQMLTLVDNGILWNCQARLSRCIIIIYLDFFGIVKSSLICFLLIRNINNIHGIIFIKFLVALSGYIFFYYNAFSLVDIGIGGIHYFHIKYNNKNINKQPILLLMKHKYTISFSLEILIAIFYSYMAIKFIMFEY